MTAHRIRGAAAAIVFVATLGAWQAAQAQPVSQLEQAARNGNVAAATYLGSLYENGQDATAGTPLPLLPFVWGLPRVRRRGSRTPYAYGHIGFAGTPGERMAGIEFVIPPSGFRHLLKGVIAFGRRRLAA